jgi:hypothetical protein
MDITVKNVSLAGQTEAEVQALLAKAHTMFAGATVSFAAAEAKAVGFEQQLATELHNALASIKKLLGLKPTVPAAAVVVAVQVAATPVTVQAVAASPAVAAVAAAPAAAATVAVVTQPAVVAAAAAPDATVATVTAALTTAAASPPAAA